MLGTYTWRDAATRHMAAWTYEEVAVGAGVAQFTSDLLELSEFGVLQVMGGPVRALWYPGCAAQLTSSFGFTYFNAAIDILNRNEMRNFRATLDASSFATPGVLSIHYYIPPTP